MFRSIKSKFVNFTRFPVIFDTYKPYDAIYKRAFAGAFLSDVNQNPYRRLDFDKPPAPVRPNVDDGRSMRQEYTGYRMKNAIPKRIDDQNNFTLLGFTNDFHQSYERDPDSLRYPEINYVQVGPGDYVKAPGCPTVHSNGNWRNAKKISYTFIVEPIITGGDD